MTTMVLRLIVPRLAAAAPVAVGDANGRDAKTITGNDDAGDAAVAPSSGQSAGSGTTRAQTCNSCGDAVLPMSITAHLRRLHLPVGAY